MATPPPDRLARELDYYRRECNELGGRLLRLQEEQGRAFREARRSRMVAQLIREAYRLSETGATPEEIGPPMLGVVAETALCDCAALLRAGRDGRLEVLHSAGVIPGAEGRVLALAEAPPAFLHTTLGAPAGEAAAAVAALLGVPCVLWACDRAAGYALALGNRTETTVARPFEAGDREIVDGALAVFVDAFRRKRAEADLREAKRVAEEASRLRTRFLATLSHDLRTPLCAVAGYAGLLDSTSRYRLTPEQRDAYAAQILDSTRHMLAVVDDILEHSRMENVAPALAAAWLPAGKILGAAAREAEAGHARPDVALRVVPEPPGPPLLVHVDPVRFRRLLVNLIGNALKFTPTGGSVEVAARRPAGPGEGAGMAIEVRDTGVGMGPEEIALAFQPYGRIENGLSPESGAAGGTGLGLPIARALAEAHGGTLVVESAPGRGTTARVTLPPHRVREAAAPPERG